MSIFARPLFQEVTVISFHVWIGPKWNKFLNNSLLCPLKLLDKSNQQFKCIFNINYIWTTETHTHTDNIHRPLVHTHPSVFCFVSKFRWKVGQNFCKHFSLSYFFSSGCQCVENNTCVFFEPGSDIVAFIFSLNNKCAMCHVLSRGINVSGMKTSSQIWWTTLALPQTFHMYVPDVYYFVVVF